jgi:hypothetical protein
VEREEETKVAVVSCCDALMGFVVIYEIDVYLAGSTEDDLPALYTIPLCRLCYNSLQKFLEFGFAHLFAAKLFLHIFPGYPERYGD